MIAIRRSDERGHADHGWLRSFHSFSFADYYDPRHMGIGPLRVINEDRVAPGRGFGAHPHRDMEIISYVLEGELAHKDSMGNGSSIRPGDVQRMSAGTGVVHSEFNNSPTADVHFLQIWIIPERTGLPPSYEQKHFDAESKRGRFCLIASPDAAEGSVRVHQDARVYAGLFDDEESGSLEILSDRIAYVHVARGAIDLNRTTLNAGDAAAFSGPASLALGQGRAAEVLVFDLPHR